MNRDHITIDLRWSWEEGAFVAKAVQLELRALGRTKRAALNRLGTGIDNWLDEHGEVMQYEVFSKRRG